MISERKKHVTKLFLNRCSVQNIMKAHLGFSIELMRNTYKVSDEDLIALKEQYSIDNYIERLFPIIDKQFSIEEMQEAIRFYSSGIGRKILDPTFLNAVNEAGHKMDKEMYQKFALVNGKS